MSADFQGIHDNLSSIDCNNISSYNNNVTKTRAFSFLSEDAILQRTADCDSYFKTMDIFGQEVSADRLSLTSESPLAFSHSIHQQAGILEVFLALTFRPRDSHCFHIDPKASDATTKAMEAIITCYNQKFPNTTMFAVPHPVPVYWGHFSVLEVGHSQLGVLGHIGLFWQVRSKCEAIVLLFQADLICTRELLERDTEWKFYMNHASSELPLITVEEMENLLWSLKRSVIDSYNNTFDSRQKYLHRWRRY